MESNKFNSNEKINLSKKHQSIIRAIAGGAIGLVLVGGGTYCFESYNADAEAAKQLNPSEENVYVVEKSDEEKKADLIESNVKSIKAEYEATMEKYENMSSETFAALPRAERSGYVQYKIDTTADKYHKYYENSVDYRDYAIEPVEVTLNNTAQEIMDNYLYTLQISYLQQTEDYSFDVESGDKILSKAYANTNPAYARTNVYMQDKELQDSQKKANVMTNSYKALERTETMNGTDRYGNPITYCLVKSEESSSSDVKYYLFIYEEAEKSYDGSTYNTWALGNVDYDTTDIVQKSTSSK